MRVLLDTNVLLRIAEPAHDRHQTAADAAETLHAGGHDLCIVPQNIYEFWAVASRTVEHNGLGQSARQAEGIIQRLCALFRLLRDERGIYTTWLDLVIRHDVCGVKSHDARLAAAMDRHGIDHLLTFNPSDFRRYQHVSILEPANVVAGRS